MTLNDQTLNDYEIELKASYIRTKSLFSGSNVTLEIKMALPLEI